MTETAPDLSDAELRIRLIYAIVVAGKSAKFAEVVIRRLCKAWGPSVGSEWPWDKCRQWLHQGVLRRRLQEAGTGNYGKLVRAIRELTNKCPDLRTCPPEELEKYHGIGPKTARFFILWTRPGARYAALDRHILRWLHENGYPDAPRQTPSSKRYKHWEEVFLKEADARNLTPRELDWQIWEQSSSSG